jgi:hypothetical protein
MRLGSARNPMPEALQKIRDKERAMSSPSPDSGG